MARQRHPFAAGLMSYEKREKGTRQIRNRMHNFVIGGQMKCSYLTCELFTSNK
jgi:hypothetical protein